MKTVQSIIFYHFVFAACVIVMITSCGGTHAVENPMYRFDVANGTLFAIESVDGSYGSERAVYVTYDSGETWEPFEAPAKTVDLAGNGWSLYALTSDGDLWGHHGDPRGWHVINDDARARDYLYSLDVDSSFRIVTAGKDAVTLYDPEGNLLAKYTSESDRSGFLSARFFGDDEQILLVEGTPFLLYVIDLQSRDMKLWNEGFRIAPPEGMSGPAQVREYGDGFLASTYDGIYFSPGLLEPWEPLTEELDLSKYVAGYFCRDLASHHPEQDEWLMARNAGIYLMHESTEEELIYEDVADDLDLIDAITAFEDHYFVSFHRHQKGKMGVRIGQDLKDVKVLTLQMPSAASTSETTPDDSSRVRGAVRIPLRP